MADNKKWSEKNLPDWKECREIIDEGSETALETFIYLNEPGGVEATANFRSQLINMLNYCLEEV